MGYGRTPAWWEQLAPKIEPDVANEEWPPGEVARYLPEQERIEVEARVVWSDGTEEWIRGHATKWTRPVALVELHDPRRARVWLPAGDIRRCGPR